MSGGLCRCLGCQRTRRLEGLDAGLIGVTAPEIDGDLIPWTAERDGFASAAAVLALHRLGSFLRWQAGFRSERRAC